MDFLQWRYGLTEEYKKKKYKKRYNQLKRRSRWEFAYWKNPVHIVERIIGCISIFLLIMTIPAIHFIINSDEPIVMSILLIPLLVFNILFEIFWFISGSMAVRKYGSKNERMKHEIYMENQPDKIVYDEKEYIKFWEDNTKKKLGKEI